MCLIVSKTRNNQRVKAFKVLEWGDSSGKSLYSPYLDKRYKLGEWAKSDNRKKTINCNVGDSLDKGIHVYTNKRDAVDNSSWSGCRVVVECLVDPSDWIADGQGNHALYKKVLPIKIVHPKW